MLEDIKDTTNDYLYDIVWGDQGKPEGWDELEGEGEIPSDAGDFVDSLTVSDNRQQLYDDYEDLFQDGIPKNVLEIYADDTVGHKLESGRRLWVESDNDEVKEKANKKLDEWGVRGYLWDTTQFLMLFGDYFYLLNLDEQNGITNVELDYHPITFRRWELKNQLAGFEVRGETTDRRGLSVQNQKSEFIAPFEAIHFRLGSSVRDLRKHVSKGLSEGGYGSSIFEANLADLKKLNVAENSLVVSRYQNQRRPMLMFIDVANHKKGKEKQKQLYSKIKNKVLKSENFDQSQGEFDSLNDLFAHSEIVPLPHTPDMIDTMDLAETVDVESIADIEYIRDRVMGNFKVPNAFLGLEDKLPSSDIGQSSLISISTRYARSVRRIQASMILPIRRMLRIHFALTGRELEPNDLSVHTQTITTAEDMTDADRAEKIASSFSSITQLFGRGPLEDVELDQEKFASFIIDSLGFTDLDATDILKLGSDGEDGAEAMSSTALERIDNFLGGSGANYHRDQDIVPESKSTNSLDHAYESWKQELKKNGINIKV